jgi:hypothetical protein
MPMKDDHLGGPSRRDLGRWLALCLMQAGSSGALDGKAARAEVRTQSGTITLANPFLKASWNASGQRLRALTFTDSSGREIRLAPDVFKLAIEGGRVLKASEMALVSHPRAVRISGDPKSVRRAGTRPGISLTAVFRDSETGASVQWRAVLLDGARYLRQELLIRAGTADLPLRQVSLWDLDLEGARVVGKVKGSPAVSGHVFLAFEHPLSTTTLSQSRVQCSLERRLPLRVGHSFACSSVIGTIADGQLRRGFLQYIEEERAHPYRTFLHYNTWYDIGYFSKFDEAAVLGRVGAFSRELCEKRGVTLHSFLLDDGWDDPATLWNFHAGFRSGLANVAKAAALAHAGTGIWLSPWGGYGKPKQDRIRLGGEQGYEIQDGGFALSGPKYYQRFREVCRRMISEYNVNQFKFDGTGNADRVVTGSQFDSDFDAAISLIGDLRHDKPDLYVNLTTGTYPSPFWLQFADSIWRGGEDHDFAGVGSWRQKWITYRDADTFEHVVSAGPLFPINSLMLHGMTFAAKAKNLNTDPGGDFRSEVRSYFGTGTQLQEMYISPELLSPQNWDDLAEAANWSRNNAATLVDTHWVGGDPAKLEVYGWASWSPAKGIFSLRNPSDREQTFPVDIERVLELPSTAPQQYRTVNAWSQRREEVTFVAGSSREVRLAPFEVLNLELIPAL